MTATETKTTIAGLLQGIRTKSQFKAAYAMLLDLLDDEGHPFVGATTRACTVPSAGLSWMMERHAVLAGLCDWTDCPAHMEAVAYEAALESFLDENTVTPLYRGNDRAQLAMWGRELFKHVGLKIRDIKVKTPKHGQPYVTMRVPRRSDVANRDYTKLHQLLAMAFPGATNNATQFCWYMN